MASIIDNGGTEDNESSLLSVERKGLFFVLGNDDSLSLLYDDSLFVKKSSATNISFLLEFNNLTFHVFEATCKLSPKL